MSFDEIYYIIWSILAIAGGIYLILFREKFIQLCIFFSKKLYEKTGFPLFKVQAENSDSIEMRMVTTIVGVIFLIVGILKIFGFIN